MTCQGSVRVVSKRAGGVCATANEVVIDVDREHPVLGNQHVLHNHKDARARDHVIDAYAADLAEDLMQRGPMSREIDRLAALVVGGQRLALRCWCAPRKCHGDLLVSLIARAAGIDVSKAEERSKEPEWQAPLW